MSEKQLSGVEGSQEMQEQPEQQEMMHDGQDDQQQQMNEQAQIQYRLPRRRVRVKSSHYQKKRLSECWNNRWNVAESKNNTKRHPYYRQYFDKDPGANAFHFQFHYGGSSPEALPGIADLRSRHPRKEYLKITDQPHKDLVSLTAETRMPVEYLTSSRKGKKRGAAFPSPEKHLQMKNQWTSSWAVTVSKYNNVHHKSQREYFDRPIDVPERGYSHERSFKSEFNTVYSQKTPMRSAQHCQQLLDQFREIELAKSEARAPKAGYGYMSKDKLNHTTGFTVSNDYGHIPGLRVKGANFKHNRLSQSANKSDGFRLSGGGVRKSV